MKRLRTTLSDVHSGLVDCRLAFLQVGVKSEGKLYISVMERDRDCSHERLCTKSVPLCDMLFERQPYSTNLRSNLHHTVQTSPLLAIHIPPSPDSYPASTAIPVASQDPR